MTTAEAKPPIFVMSAVYTADPCYKTIVRTLEDYRFVVAVRIIFPGTVTASVIGVGTKFTLKTVNTVLFAVAVYTFPELHGSSVSVTLEIQTFLPVVEPSGASRFL